MTTATTATHPSAAARPALHARVLADLVAGTRSREVAIVLAGTALIVLAGRLAIPLPFTPVPISLSTLAVLGLAATTGARRSVLSAALYTVLGLVGLPVFVDGHSGWGFAAFGYTLGYVAAAALLGVLAQRGWSRRVRTLAPAVVVSTLCVYVPGVVWLVAFLGISPARALAVGVVPFLPGDALKAAVLLGTVPTAWHLLETRPS